jgi:hypothetical protein
MEKFHASHPQWVLQVFNPDGDRKITAQEVIAGVDVLMDFMQEMASAPANGLSGRITPEDFSARQSNVAIRCRIKTEAAPSPDRILERVKTLFTRMNIGNLIQDIEYPEAALLQPSISRWNKATKKACSI